METIGYHLVAQEWDVIPGYKWGGKGDLVFQQKNRYLVIECKRQTVPYVYEQAKYYAAAWKYLYAPPRASVMYGVWTCELWEILGKIRSKKDARIICNRTTCELFI